jgi:hypothetical protein
MLEHDIYNPPNVQFHMSNESIHVDNHYQQQVSSKRPYKEIVTQLETAILETNTNSLAKIIKSTSLSQMEDNHSWVIHQCKHRARLSIRINDNVYFYDTISQNICDKNGLINNGISPPANILLTQLSNVISALPQPEFLNVNNIFYVKDDPDVYYDIRLKCLFSKKNQKAVDGYNVSSEMLSFA